MATDLKNIAKQLSELTVMEAAELSKMLEEEWGVSAAAPVAVAAAGASAGDADVEEKSDFDVILTGFDAAKKISVIKAVKEATGSSLGDSKALVEGAPKAIKETCPKVEAEELKKALEAAGATVELK